MTTNRISILYFFVIFLVLSPAQSGTMNYIWWEGENPAETNFPNRTWFSSSSFPENRHLLSEEQWLTNSGDRSGEEAFAVYEIDVETAGMYQFWVRKMWKHGPFRWRFDDADWRICPRDVALADEVVLMEHVPANWISLGEVDLTAGTHRFELRLLASKGESLTAGFDCFVLTDFPFMPRGKLKPDQKSGKANEGFFPWEPSPDEFKDEALLDLRSLNETEAGVNGFVRAEGMDLILGDGRPVRFWGVNASSGIAGLNRASIDYLARKLAKMGINLVRYHSPLFESGNPMEMDDQKLDDLFYFVTALKREGIYTFISFYFPLWFDIQPSYGIPGFESTNNKKPFVLLFFNERMQAFHRRWLRGLLTIPNPYTGKTLADEPAIAVIELQNEDSFFFWTFTKDNVPKVHWQELEQRFGAWLAERYGSLDKAFRTWGKRESGDDSTSGRAALYEAWHMTGDAVRQANAAKKRRLSDQVCFLTELQRGFYEDTIDYIRNDLGSKSLISPSNWHTSDPVMLDALERYTYTAGEVIDRHGYYSAPHKSGDGSHSYDVRVGHTFENRSALKIPHDIPLQFIQMEDHPQTISEIGWTNPNLYRADYAFLASAYGALQGIDSIMTFALGGAYWDTSMKKFALSCPVILGNFPAYALIYRRGYVPEAKTVIRQELTLEDLFALKGSGGATAQNLDAFREADVPPGEAVEGGVNAIDPLAYYVGRVVRAYGDDPAKSFQLNLAEHIDRQAKTVKSIEGLLKWNYGQGVVKMNTPKSQGAAGFLSKAGEIVLDDIALRVDNEYASLIAVSLDDKPLEESSEILIQTMTVEHPYNFKASDGDSGRIESLGEPPFGVEKIKANITLFNSGSAEIIALDENGMPRNVTVFTRSGSDGALIMNLVEDSVYHIVRRRQLSCAPTWPLQTH